MAGTNRSAFSGIAPDHVDLRWVYELVRGTMIVGAKTAKGIARRVCPPPQDVVLHPKYGRLVTEGLLIEAGYAPSTARTYALGISDFAAWVGGGRADSLHEDDIAAYLQHLAERSFANGTIRTRLCALRTLLDRVLELNVTWGISHVDRPVARPPAAVEQVEALLEACAASEDELVLRLLNGGKLRPGEIATLGLGPAEDRPGGGPAYIPLCFPPADAEAPEVRRVLPSCRCPGRPVCTRTVQRILERVRARCRLTRITCTAVRMAPRIPLGRAG